MTCPTPGCHRRAVIDQPDGSRLCWGCATRASGVSVAPPPPPKPGRPMIARVWTPAEDAKLRAMWERGVRVEDIAVALGRNEDGVSRHAHAIGLSRRRPGPAAST